MEYKTHPVTKFDSCDWESYNGATEWSKSQPPLMRYFDSKDSDDPSEPAGCIIADAEVVCLHHFVKDVEVVVIDSSEMSHVASRLYLKSLPNNLLDLPIHELKKLFEIHDERLIYLAE